MANSKLKPLVAGIIVSFHPEIEELIFNINNLVQEVDLIFLIENGSPIEIQQSLVNSIKHKKVEITLNPKNLGLAAAQNIGINKALDKNIDFILFLDDDSNLKIGSVSKLIQEFEQNQKLGIAASNIIHNDSGKIQKYWIKLGSFYKRVGFVENTQKLENVNTVISSGSVISRKVIEKCGLMREDFFIDYIDIEYCLRVRANGYSITVIRNAELIHKLGNTKSIQVGNLSIHPTNHNPSRRFYMIRNRIWTWKLYISQFPDWFLIDFGNLLFDYVRVFFFEKDRLKNFKFFLLGLRDGVFQKAKPISPRITKS